LLGDRQTKEAKPMPARTPTATLPLLDLPAVAARLGVNHRYVRRLVAERRIPFIKLGHLLRFDPAELEAWLDQARRSWSPWA
jgi:excisionase family DNA binding protein